MNSLHGFLVFDKPSGVTSRDVVDRAQGCFPRKTKLGHAGTLDPLATGVLVVAVGYATRLIEFVQEMPKSYTTTVALGATSNTDDADGDVTPVPGAAAVSLESIREILTTMIGDYSQRPPDFSAALVDGQRAYAIARKGKPVELDERVIRIDAIEVLAYEWPLLTLQIDCGKGTYIRSIARDLGAALGVGGYVATLRRTRIGQFDCDQALTMTADRSVVAQGLHPMLEAVPDWPSFTVDEAMALGLRQGKWFSVELPPGRVAILDSQGQLMALGMVDGGLLKPNKVLPGLS